MSRSMWNQPVPRVMRTGAIANRALSSADGKAEKIARLEARLAKCEKKIRYAMTVNGLNRIVEETREMNSLRAEIRLLEGK